MSEVGRNFRWLAKYYKPFKKRLVLIALQSVAVAVLTAATPFVYIKIIDGIQNNLSLKFLAQATLVLAVLGITSFFLSVTNATRRAKTNLELEWHFRQSLFSRLIRYDQNFYLKYRTGDAVTRLTDDVGRKLSWFACSGVFRSYEAVLKISFSIGAMLLINPVLTIVALAPFPLQMVIFIKTRAVLDGRFNSLQGFISKVNETIETCFSGIKIIQAYAMERKQAEKFAAIAAERAAAEVNAEKAHLFIHFLYGYFWQLAQVFILLAGGAMVIKQALTVGEFVAFNYYMTFLVWPMFDLGGFLVGYRRAAVSIKRIREMEDYHAKVASPEQGVVAERESGRIVFTNVSFQINGKPILDNISFDSGNERMIAVVGEVGSGKSTLLGLLCRFYDPTSGQITLDGVPLPQWDLSALRRRIGYVSQEPLLFTDTVANNIRFGRPHVEDAAIEWASDIAQLTEEIATFNDGYQTSIGLRGMTVSGGQKQRISISRALAGEPTLLLLDDATAHLDAETEAVFWQRIFRDLPHLRTIFVSHRVATLEQADVILVLKDGRLVEQGRHQDLLEAKAEYYRLYN